MATKDKITTHERVAQKLRDWIQSKGPNAGGCRVPPIRQIARDHDVSTNTAMSVLRQLESEGWIERLPHCGAVIAERPDPRKAPAAPKRGRQIAVLGPLSLRQEYAWSDDWGVRILMAAEEAILNTGGYFPVRVGAVEPGWARVIDKVIEQVRVMGTDLAGVIVPWANNQVHQNLFEVCDELGVPWVSINRPLHTQMHNFVALDDLVFGKTAGQLCLELELAHVLVLAYDFDFLSNSEKMLGLMQAYWQAGRHPGGVHCVSCGGYKEQHGYEATLAHIREHGKPQMIFGLGDWLAVGALRACESQGLGVPEDVRLLSGTGMALAECTSPPLAVLAQPMRAMGQQAAHMLLGMIKTGQLRTPGRLLSPTFVPRASLGISQDQAARVAQKSGIRLGEPSSPEADDDDQGDVTEAFLTAE